ncbi:hypothetical protein RRG08_025729 [Elysia crispata]|uniref:Uncharacterized protein n=1 Tax=Elysia crispata TaxID=231223 RepID=A0AAE1AGH9_9GAST|nr:hypothetical protein RRG08_025729 [Elysia crispata]
MPSNRFGTVISIRAILRVNEAAAVCLLPGCGRRHFPSNPVITMNCSSSTVTVGLALFGVRSALRQKSFHSFARPIASPSKVLLTP